MKARSALVYTVLRLLAFLVPFGILMLFPVFQDLYWLAAVFAALIGLSLSILFLRRPLNDVTTGLAERRRERERRDDDAAEDAAADTVYGDGIRTVDDSADSAGADADADRADDAGR
ncbi:DUF4229 domain-containing protein [Microbacterium xanthum]|uniref:DUF4229 domain-containing protein n=1 Tax=Microbacterium xanthum TaxID=3079794 RepID=UPI002AD5A95C|nr:DUF4229 domain-containing protein [Microbacterium sp. KSW-48]MDZ8171748.1 DUF4229 domain-containing protein [Microbacterium sp. KSW-48]